MPQLVPPRAQPRCMPQLVPPRAQYSGSGLLHPPMDDEIWNYFIPRN